MSDIELADRFAWQNEVVSRYLKGMSPWAIAKELKVKTPEVNSVISEWHKVAANDSEVRGRAQEALANMDEHFNMIINKLWDAVEECDLSGDIKTKNSILKNIADIEAKRLDSLQKAGLLDDQKMGDQVVKTQQRLDQVKELLKEVTAKCDHCRIPVAQGLGRIWNEATVINVESSRTE